MDEIAEKISQELGLSTQVILRTYRAYWRCIKDTIQSLPLKDNLSQEEFNNIKTNINIPSLGKLSVTWDRYVGVKKRYNHIKQIKEKNA